MSEQVTAGTSPSHVFSPRDNEPERLPGSMGKIGVLSNGGSLPALVAAAAKARGYDVFVMAFKGIADDKTLEQYPHVYQHLGQTGRMFSTLRENGCKRVVMIGSLRRPNLWAQRFDLGFFRHLPRLIRMVRGGDDSVMRKVASFFESQGFEVIAAHELAPELLAPAGVFSKAAPDKRALADAAMGFKVVEALGRLDVGQAAVVVNGHVLAVEAAEGTDAMLRRCAALDRDRRKVPMGVLVKAPKPGQETRLDLPAIGPRTVQLAADAGLAGLAVAAGQVLVAEHGELVEKADRLGLFLYGSTGSEA